MKRSLFFAAMILVCLMIFTACGCEHVWEEATCMAPKTCSVCGKSDGVFSDHTWTDATCLAPKTCTICGITEGTLAEHTWAEATCMAPQTCTLCSTTGEKKLEHSWQPANCEMPEHCPQCGIKRGGVVHTFGNWQVENALSETMSRTCTGCQLEQANERNDLTLANQSLVGHWDFATPSKNQDTPQPYVYFPAQGNGIFYDGENTHEIQRKQFLGKKVWQVSYGYSTEYYFSFYIPELDELGARLEVDDAGAVSYLSILIGDDVLTFFRIPSVETAVTGTYNMVHEGQIRQITLHEDRTLTSNLFGKEISGTWQLPPIRSDGYGYSLDVRFYYTMDGKDCCATSLCYINNGDVSLLEYLESSRLDMRLVIRDGYDEKYYDLYPADEEGHRLLAGLWESTRIISRTENGDLLKDESTNAYSITFMEDGTFTAVLDKELQGTWMFYKKSLGLNDSANYHYILCFDDGAYEARALLYGDELSVYTQDQPTSNKVEFIAMTEEAIAKREALRAEVANLVSGEWTGTYGSLQNLAVGSDEIEAYQQTFDYSITFAEDGTFTATLDQDYTGTWTFLESIKVDDPQYAFSFTYMYRLNCDGLLDGAFVSVYAQSAIDSYEAKASQSCSLQITYSPDGDDRSGYFNFRQFSPESLQKVQEAAKEIVGSWTAVSATSCTREWSKIKNIPDCKYTLTVYADGTYTVVLDRTYTGTWIYDCNPHPDYDTSYHFSNSNTNSTIELDGTLSFRHYYADGYVEVTFRRNES